MDSSRRTLLIAGAVSLFGVVGTQSSASASSLTDSSLAEANLAEVLASDRSVGLGCPLGKGEE